MHRTLNKAGCDGCTCGEEEDDETDTEDVMTVAVTWLDGYCCIQGKQYQTGKSGNCISTLTQEQY